MCDFLLRFVVDLVNACLYYIHLDDLQSKIAAEASQKNKRCIPWSVVAFSMLHVSEGGCLKHHSLKEFRSQLRLTLAAS